MRRCFFVLGLEVYRIVSVYLQRYTCRSCALRIVWMNHCVVLIFKL